jgi:predicted HicB family RNase H-like nuclease
MPQVIDPGRPVIAVTTTPEMKATVIAAAAAEQRSLSNWVLIAIQEKLARQDAT